MGRPANLETSSLRRSSAASAAPHWSETVLLLKIPRPEEAAHLNRIGLRRLTEADVPHSGIAYVGMSRARTRLHVIIQEDCDERHRERESEWQERQESDVEML